MCCPRWLFLVPGLLLVLLGIAGFALAMPGVTLGKATFDAHTLVFASLATLCGYQSILFALCAKRFAISEGLMPADQRSVRLISRISLEQGLLVGVCLMVSGLVLLLAAVNQWRRADFGRLDYSTTMRWVVSGATLTALGFQTILSSFFLSILSMRRR